MDVVEDYRFKIDDEKNGVEMSLFMLSGGTVECVVPLLIFESMFDESFKIITTKAMFEEKMPNE